MTGEFFHRFFTDRLVLQRNLDIALLLIGENLLRTIPISRNPIFSWGNQDNRSGAAATWTTWLGRCFCQLEFDPLIDREIGANQRSKAKFNYALRCYNSTSEAYNPNFQRICSYYFLQHKSLLKRAVSAFKSRDSQLDIENWWSLHRTWFAEQPSFVG